MKKRSIALILLLLCFINQASSQDDHDHREALEIIIGGGGGGDNGPPPAEPPEYECAPPPPPPEECPPPPPPPSPPPPSPPPPSPPPPSPPPPSPPPPSPPPPSPPPPRPPKISPRVVKAAKVIQRFRKLIDVDPQGVTNTWHGDNACKYRGFRCDQIPDQDRLNAVSGLDFNGFGFTNNKSNLPLDGFINELEDLAFFHANSNNFTGSVPNIDLSKIRFLYELDLSNNKLKGEFPQEVLKAKNLTFLDLRFNNLVGNVPQEVFNLDVDVIFINNNKFSNQLPANLGDTPALYLTFANNGFTGQIPKSIGRASETLIEVLFLNNHLSGCLPYEIGKLKKTTYFDASQNYITGPIPQSFACLGKIEVLNLARNRLFGAIPESLCKLGFTANLQNLSLSENYFTQVGPECRKLIQKKYLDVNKNCILDLPNQRTKEDCERFFTKKTKCPDEKWMTYIPCRNEWYRGAELPPVAGRKLLSESASDDDDALRSGGRGSSPSSWVTYGSLTPNGL